MKLFGRDCGCAKRKQYLKDRGLWPGGRPRHIAKATQVHEVTRARLLDDIALTEAEIEAYEYELDHGYLDSESDEQEYRGT